MSATPRQRLRARLASGPLIVAPGIYDAFGARLVEQAGCEAVYMTGNGVSASLLGKPDVGLVDLTLFAQHAHRAAACVNIPLICDADTAYGNAVNVRHTVQEFEAAGVAAIHIEDQVAPKRCGHVAGKEVISLAEMAGKIRAADRVRRELDPDFLLIARCDARGVAGGSIDDLVRRANAYLDAGADMIFPEALTTEAEVERCAREIKGPLHYNRTGVSPRLTLAQLNELGVAIVSNATGALRSSMIAMWDYMNAFAAEDVAFVKEFTEKHRQHPAGDLHAFVGFAEIKKFEEEFLPADDVAKKYAGAIGFQP